MDFREEYKQKLVSADEAVKLIKSGDWVDYGWCTNTVDALDQALAKRTDELTDVKLRGGILMKPLAVFAREDAGEHFCWNSWHMSGIAVSYTHLENRFRVVALSHKIGSQFVADFCARCGEHVLHGQLEKFVLVILHAVCLLYTSRCV